MWISVSVGIYQSVYPLWLKLVTFPPRNPGVPPSDVIICWVWSKPSPIIGMPEGPVCILPIGVPIFPHSQASPPIYLPIGVSDIIYI